MIQKITTFSLALLLVATQGCCLRKCSKPCMPATLPCVTQCDKETYNPCDDYSYQVATTIVDATTPAAGEVIQPMQFAEEVNLNDLDVSEMDMLPAYQAEAIELA